MVRRMRAVAPAQGQDGAWWQYRSQIGRLATTCPGVSNLSVGTLVANSELPVCSGAAKVGSLAFKAILGPLAAT